MTTAGYLKCPGSGLVSKALSDIVQKAYEFIATGVSIIPTKKIIVDYNLAARCKEPRCENYGLSKSCPPYVSGPTGFKNLLQKFQQAVFFKNPQYARPSMSGFGINVSKLFEAAGWTMSAINHGSDVIKTKMTFICGLVLIF